MTVQCPKCGADLRKCGAYRVEVHICDWKEENKAFDEIGLFNQQTWQCPKCGEDVSEVVEPFVV